MHICAVLGDGGDSSEQPGHVELLQSKSVWAAQSVLVFGGDFSDESWLKLAGELLVPTPESDSFAGLTCNRLVSRWVWPLLLDWMEPDEFELGLPMVDSDASLSRPSSLGLLQFGVVA